MQSIQTILSASEAELISTIHLSMQEAKFESQLLLQHILKVNRAWLISHESDTLQANKYEDFQALLTRRLAGEPIAYILGMREFYGLNLKVTPDTLIPRPDTEILVEAALDKIAINTSSTILDLGTGTGAIALAIAKNRPEADVTAVDASANALQVARTNAQYLNLHNITLIQSDWFFALAQQRFDVIVSNPPYIEAGDAHLSLGDLRFEPHSALVSGDDGLKDIRHIISQSLAYLKPQAWLMLEHGFNQAEAVADLMAETGLVDIMTLKDLGGHSRVTLGKNPLFVSTHWD